MPTNVSAHSSLRRIGFLLFGLTFAVLVSTLSSLSPAQAAVAAASVSVDDDDGRRFPVRWMSACASRRDSPRRSSTGSTRSITTSRVGPIGSRRRIHMTESFTLRSWLRVERRAMLMLPGPLANGDIFNVEVDGYRGREIMAHHRYFAFSVDYEGVGGSTYPANGRGRDRRSHGRGPSTGHQLRPAHPPRAEGRPARRRDRRRLRGGTGLRRRARPLRDHDGDDLQDGFGPVQCGLREPRVRGVPAQPPGRLPADRARELLQYRRGVAAGVADWIRTTQPGRYSVAPLFGAFHLPWFDPTRARVPGIVIQGEFDQNAPQSDPHPARDRVRQRRHGRRRRELHVHRRCAPAAVPRSAAAQLGVLGARCSRSWTASKTTATRRR